jgi:ATP-binding cassette subfamily B multidrug efflux pump
MAENSGAKSSSGRGPSFMGHSGPGSARDRTIERAKNVRGAMSRLLVYVDPYRGRMLVILAVAVVSTLLAIGGPYFMGRAIDGFIHHQRDQLVWMTLAMLGAYGLSAATQIVQGILLADAAQKVMRSLRADLFRHLQTLSLKFFDSHNPGDLMSRLTNDMDAINQVLTNNGAQLFTGVLTIIGVLSVIFILSPWLALGSMVAFPLMIGLVGIVGKRTRTSFREYQKRLGELNSVLEETYSGQRVVLAFGQEQRVLVNFDQANAEATRVGTKAMISALVVMPMMGILANLNVAVICGLGGWLALKGLVTVGTIASFITYSRRFAEPLRQLGDLYNQVQAALAGAERIFALLDTEPDQADGPDAIALTGVKGEVEFSHISFAYVPGTPVLQDVSIYARPGERIALVGHTGAGKTTLVNLLSRFYNPGSGAIRIDGIDIRRIKRTSLRRQIGAVLQQSFLFSESVMENIRYGRLDASEDEVMRAAELAHADGFIRRLPKGYDTVLAERGTNLSEGQRQLVTIARAILADPAILVLDEATSSVDTRTEAAIQRALQKLMLGRTSFVIAHRLSTIVNADRIVVIDQGRVVEQGTHQELLAAKGVYRRLYLSQFRGSYVDRSQVTSVGECGSIGFC